MRKIKLTLAIMALLSVLNVYIVKGFCNDTQPYCREHMKGPSLSGPAYSMPWEEDFEFLAFQDMYNVPILLGGYKTVLLEPLPGEEYNVSVCSSYLKGMVIQPGESFSFNRRLGPYNKERGFMEGPTYSGTTLIKSTGGGVCKVATTLYNAAVLGNLSITERHNHTMPVSYVEYGQDASVAFDYKDLKLFNNKTYPVLIWAEGVDNTMYIGIYGMEAPPKVEWKHETSGIKYPLTIYKKNALLKPGEIKELVKGMEGRTVMSWAHITYQDGREETKYLGKSVYEPLPCIVEIGG